MKIYKFGTFQILLCYSFMNFYYNCINEFIPNILSTMIATHMMTIGISGSFIFYTNFNHYKIQYNNIPYWQLILMDFTSHIIPILDVIYNQHKYIIYPIPYESIILEYIYGILYFFA